MSDEATPQRYVQNPVEVLAVPLRSIGDLRRAAQWFNNNGGGSALVADTHYGQYLLLANGSFTVEAPLGSFLVKGAGGFRVVSAGEMALGFTEVATDDSEGTPKPAAGMYGTARPTKMSAAASVRVDL